MAEQPEPRRRVEAYILNVEQALERVREDTLPPRGRHILRLVRDYVSDARYYLENGDVFTALADIAYAEGLLDALRWLGLADIEWKPLTSLLKRPKVLVAGTFDIIHPGHIELMRQAWLRGTVYAVVARDKTVEKIKGRKPIIPEQQRLEVVSAIRYVSNAILGSTRDVLDPIREIRPDIILLGPDQWASEQWLKETLEREGINARIERLPEKKQCPLCSTTSIICKILREADPAICNR